MTSRVEQMPLFSLRHSEDAFSYPRVPRIGESPLVAEAGEGFVDNLYCIIAFGSGIALCFTRAGAVEKSVFLIVQLLGYAVQVTSVGGWSL